MDLRVEGIASTYDDALKQACEQAVAFFGPNRAYVLKDFEAHPYETSYGVAVPDLCSFSATARYSRDEEDTGWELTQSWH